MVKKKKKISIFWLFIGFAILFSIYSIAFTLVSEDYIYNAVNGDSSIFATAIFDADEKTTLENDNKYYLFAQQKIKCDTNRFEGHTSQLVYYVWGDVPTQAQVSDRVATLCPQDNEDEILVETCTDSNPISAGD